MECHGWAHDAFFGDDLTNAPVISTNVVTFGRGEFDLPAGLDPANVAFLFVFDTNGVVDFNGDFTRLTNLSAIYYEEAGSVAPGNAPAGAGTGQPDLLKLLWIWQWRVSGQAENLVHW